ncbi:MAG: polyketide synthase, partial [Myxococcota bacterium]
MSATELDGAVAIVGMACRFPDAPDTAQYWANLRAGREAVQFFTDDELVAAGVARDQLDQPGFVRAGVMLDDIDRFDAAFFGISPRQAQILDPQHRLFLETAWTALESAGVAPGRSAGRIGVFAGGGVSSYFLRNLLVQPRLMATVGAGAVRHANRIDNLATRVAYHLDLDGAALTVQTCCSSGLVAVHLACQSVLGRESDLALAGAVNVNAGQGHGYRHQPGGINSPDGHCRAFDAAAAGTIFGSGVGAVVLKRAEDAVADGDRIHALILGSAINNDGAEKLGYTAPSISGQEAVITEALAIAGVDPDALDFVEAHGT